MSAALPLRHLLLALAVVTVWGTNFPIIRLALDQLPPLLFAALRFALAFVPAVFFVPRPAERWRDVALYGVLVGTGQFGLMYIAIDGRISPGLASLVIQTQVFFTIGLAVLRANDRAHAYQVVGLLLASAGILVIGEHTDGGTASLAGLLLVLAAAFCWACANVTAVRARPANMLAYVVWSSAYAVPPLLALSLVFEGPGNVGSALRGAHWGTWAAVAWQSWGNTLFGYGVWAWLLARHPAATISPLALLVPVFGMGASALILAEALPAWKLAAAGLVMVGLGVNLFWPRVLARA